MRSVISVTLNKGKQMGFGFKQPLVGEKRCVTTLVTAAKETKMRNAKLIAHKPGLITF